MFSTDTPRAAPGAHLNRGADRGPRFDLLAVIRAAQQAWPYAERIAPGATEPHAIIATPAAAGGGVPLSQTIIGALDGDARVNVAPRANRRPGEVTTLRDEIRKHSRVLSAGAHLLEVPPPLTPEAAARVGIPATERAVVGLQIAHPATFATPAEDGALPALALAEVVSIDRGNLSEIATTGARVRITRADLWSMPEPELAASVMLALASGAAEALDRALLGAMLAALPDDGTKDFNLARAAAAGLAFGELRALIGSAGAGASVGEDGELRAAGVAGELTAAATETLIAAWHRFGALVQPEVQVITTRLDAAGAVEITAFWGIAPLVPSARYAWRVPA